jgi:hypothetical protein
VAAAALAAKNARIMRGTPAVVYSATGSATSANQSHRFSDQLQPDLFNRT